MHASASTSRPRCGGGETEAVSVARSATMGDVARAAGVSHQTVSRVLNDSDAVRPDTRLRVLAAIEELGYRRNIAARALVTRRSHTLGVISFGSQLYGPASMLFAIEQAARQAGYYISVASERQIDDSSLKESLRRLEEQSVEGLVVIATQHQAQAALSQLPHGLPAIVVEGRADGGVPTVSVDQVDGARQATRHLLASGATTVHHVAGPSDWLEAEARVDGWAAELAEAGAPVPDLLRGDWSARSGYDAGWSLARGGEAQAVFVANDQMALGLLRAFSEAGVRVPEDVLVVGFDDVPESAFYFPPLSTVRQDFDALGRHSIEMLVAQLNDGVLPHSVMVPAELVVRRSSTRG